MPAIYKSIIGRRQQAVKKAVGGERRRLYIECYVNNTSVIMKVNDG